MWTFAALVLGTFVSEDLTCIAAGLLIQRGQLELTSGVGACIAGIFLGDLGLWAMGRVCGRAALAWPWMARRIQGRGCQELGEWLDRHAAGAIVGSRFTPGLRLPLYVIAGVLGMRGGIFALWALVAAALWAPTIVLLTASLGDAFVTRIAPMVGLGWPRVCSRSARSSSW
jgi:membrane protein DedA with SNARE-associated domain